MKTAYWLGFGLLVCAWAAGAQSLWETDFSSQGQSSFIVQAGEDAGCRSVSLNVPASALAQANADVFLFVHAKLPNVERAGQKDAWLSASVNSTELGSIKTERLSCLNAGLDEEGRSIIDCYWSVHVPTAIVLAGPNDVRVCAKASSNVPTIEVLDSSQLGVYRLPDFSDESSFSLEVSDTSPVIGSLVNIQYKVTNNGHAPAVFHIDRAVNTVNALDKPYYRVVEGQSFVDHGELGPGETAVFSHSIRVKSLGAVTLPPAIVFWSQELSDGTVLDLWRTSNQPTIVIRAPDRKIEGFLVHAPTGLFTGQPESVSLQVKNTGEDPVYNLVVGVEPQANSGLELKNVSNASIESLLPGQTATINLVMLASAPGSFSVECATDFLDLGISENICQDAKLSFKDTGLPPLVVGSAILVILSIGIYAYFYFVP